MPSSCTNDTTSVSLNIVGGKLEATAIVDPDATNGLSIRANGLYTPSAQSPWLQETGTWTYVSASSFTIPTDLTSVYFVGVKLSWTDASAKQGYVASSSYSAPSGLTTVNVIGEALSGAAITLPTYSYASSPYAFKHWFAWDSAPAGWTGTPTSDTKFALVGRQIFTEMYANGTSNATSITCTLPLAPVAPAAGLAWFFRGYDAGAYLTAPSLAIATNGSTTLTCYATTALGGWTNSGGKRVVGLCCNYQI